MIKPRLLLIVFLLSFVIAMVALVPVRLLWPQIVALQTLPVDSDTLSGTLWSGSGRVLWDDQLMDLNWRFRPTDLLSATLGYSISVVRPGVDMVGQAAWRPGYMRLAQVDGFMDASLLNPLLSPHAAHVGGQLWVSDLIVDWNQRQGHLQADGELEWQQGQASFQWVDGSQQTVDLPRLDGRLHTDDQGQTVGTLVDGEADQPLLLTELAANGELMFRIYSHWRNLLPLDLPGGSEIIMDSQINVREYLQ